LEAPPHAWHCKPEEWMQAFIKECAYKADFISYHHYGPQGEKVEVLTNDIKKWSDKFRAIPGKANGKIMITEIDAWFGGWAKSHYMMERQFRFLDQSDLLLSIHHFCCLAYNESGNHVFGIVNTQGGVIEGNFWPYWIFKNYTGNNAYYLRQGKKQGDYDLAASHDSKGGKWIGNAVFHNRKNTPINIRTYLYFKASREKRVLVFNKISKNFKGIEKVKAVEPGTDKIQLNVNLGPEESLALTLQESGKRFFDFRDMNNQEAPWISLISSKETLNFGESCDLNIRVLNTNFSPVSGKISIEALPQEWLTYPSGDDLTIKSLKFGETKDIKIQLKANGIVPGGVISPYAILESSKWSKKDLNTLPHSIPCSIKVRTPLKTQILPLPVFGVAGEKNQITLQITNMMNKNVSGTFSFKAPLDWKPENPDKEFSVPSNKTMRYHFPFNIRDSASPGKYTGTVTLGYLGTELKENFTVEIVKGNLKENALALDISPWINIDCVSFNTNRKDYTRDHLGMFVYPGDFTPSGRIAQIRGIPYRFMPLEDTLNNSILPQGQIFEVPEGKYTGVSLIGYGHDGKHPGDWYFHYTDGTGQRAPSEIPEWCSPPPTDEFKHAFNAPYRYIDGGPAEPACQLWQWTIKTDPEKTLKAIEFPTFKQAYIFAITLLKD
jgi:putative glycosyl hydrolase